MRKVIIEGLARLASEAYQDRYIAHGTIEAYEVPGDLVNDAVSDIPPTLSNEIFSKALAENEKTALKDFMQLIKDSWEAWYDLNRMDRNSLLVSPQWRKFVAAAQECLLKLGIERDTWDTIAFKS